jgi:hypothetical protein
MARRMLVSDLPVRWTHSLIVNSFSAVLQGIPVPCRQSSSLRCPDQFRPESAIAIPSRAVINLSGYGGRGFFGLASGACNSFSSVILVFSLLPISQIPPTGIEPAETKGVLQDGTPITHAAADGTRKHKGFFPAAISRPCLRHTHVLGFTHQ